MLALPTIVQEASDSDAGRWRTSRCGSMEKVLTASPS